MNSQGRIRARLKERVVETGLALGLPEDWLRALPEIGEVPGRNESPADGQDVLTWKAQEMLLRAGRLGDLDPDLVAEALEHAANSDGARWFHDALYRLMFILAWPKRTYHLHVELWMALERIRGCLADSPSMGLFDNREELQLRWSLARHQVLTLDDTVPEPPERSPWSCLDDVLAAADERRSRDAARFP